MYRIHISTTTIEEAIRACESFAYTMAFDANCVNSEIQVFEEDSIGEIVWAMNQPNPPSWATQEQLDEANKTLEFMRTTQRYYQAAADHYGPIVENLTRDLEF